MNMTDLTTVQRELAETRYATLENKALLLELKCMMHEIKASLNHLSMHCTCSETQHVAAVANSVQHKLTRLEVGLVDDNKDFISFEDEVEADILKSLDLTFTKSAKISFDEVVEFLEPVETVKTKAVEAVKPAPVKVEPAEPEFTQSGVDDNAPTHDDIKASCMKFHKLGYAEQIKAILAGYGATKAVDVPQDKIAECLEAILDLNKTKPAAKPVPDKADDLPFDVAPAKSGISDDDLKEVLLKASRAGHKDAVKELLKEYGGNKAADIPQGKRAGLIARVGEL